MWWRRVWPSGWFRVSCLSVLLFGALPYLLKKISLTTSLSDGIYIGTGIAVLWYTLETFGMRQEMMASRQRLETPEVSIRFEQIMSGFFDIVVENISAIPARNLAFRGAPPFPIRPGVTTADIGFLRHGIRYLAPKQVYRAFFLQYPSLDQNTQHSTITITCSFENTLGRPFSETVELNLSLFYDVHHLAADFQSRVLACLESMTTTLQEIRGSLGSERQHGGGRP